MRLRRKPWIDKALDEVAGTYLYIDDLAHFQGHWHEQLGGRKLAVEIGCGKGKFISGMGVLHPEIGFLGVESARDVAFFAARKAQEAKLENVKILYGHAEHLAEWFQPGEIEALYLNFSDPWPKTRHAKRRLTHHDFLALYEKLLKPGGHLRFKTDNRALFDFSLTEFKNFGLKILQLSYDLHHSGLKNEVQTEYEERFSAEGVPINFCEAEFVKRREA